MKRLLFLYLLVSLSSLSSPEFSRAIEPRDNTPANGRFSLSINLGWASYRMTEFNKYFVDGYNDRLQSQYGHVSNGPLAVAEINYSALPNISFALGVSYLKANTTSSTFTTIYVDGYGNTIDSVVYENKLSSYIVSPQAKIKYHFSLRGLHLFCGSGIAWTIGRLIMKDIQTAGSLQRPDYGPQFYRAGGAGISLFIGSSHEINKAVSINGEIGYRLYNSPTLSSKDGGDFTVDYNGQATPIKLNYSGAYLGIGSSFNL